jgi:hypothetical protein
MRQMIKDPELADEVQAIERSREPSPVETLHQVLAVVRRRYAV